MLGIIRWWFFAICNLRNEIMNIPTTIDLKNLPITTQYQLERLINGTQKVINVQKLKSRRLLSGELEEAFAYGLAVEIYKLLVIFNKRGEEEL